MKPRAIANPLAVACAAHAALTVLLFADVLFLGRLPYLRDVATYYYPDYVFAAGALRDGAWPLWNPTADAGAPFLLAYPLDLAMLLALGARRTLMLSPPLHVWLAMCGATLLARRLGWSARAAWTSGAVLGLSGFLLSSLNLFELAHGAAWAPVVLACYLRALERRDGRSAALLGLAAAMQFSTLAGEVLLQTALAALVLTRAWPDAKQWRALGSAAAVAIALSTPAAFGLRTLLEGGARAAGFTSRLALGWSAHPVVLAEIFWPRLLGDPHTMTDRGYWGQPYFPDGAPYLASLYLGPLVLAFAACATRQRRLWLLAALGVLLALGAHGPLSGLLPAVLPQFRTPVKFLFLTTLALALLAGRGLQAAEEDRRRRALTWLGTGAGLFVAAGLLLWLAPGPSLRAGALWPRLAAPEAAPFVALWRGPVLQTGVLCALAALALRVGPRAALGPPACVAASLLAVNAGVEASAPGTFYDLRAEVAALVRAASAAGPGRWFTYGIVNTPGLAWSPALLARNQDVWLYYMDRQTLWGRARTLDGLEGALDEDRTGWAPAGSTLSGAEARPALHRQHHARMRLAGVRWILSFVPLPEDLATPRGEARLPEIAQPLLLFEMRDALPRAFWVPDCEAAGSAEAVRVRTQDPSFDPRRAVVLERAPDGRTCGGKGGAGSSETRWRRVGPHVVEIEAEGDAGWLVFLEGYHSNWRVEPAIGGGMLSRGDGRYWALPAPAGRVRYRLSYAPSWLGPAAVVAAIGALLAVALGLRGAEKLDRSSSVALASGD